MSDTPTAPNPLPVPGWYRDPSGHGDARYWNGVAWTDAVSRGSVTFQSPMPQEEVRIPPLPGTEYRAPAPPAAATPPVPPPTPPKRSSGPSVLVGIAVAGVLILLGVLLFSIVFDDDNDDEDAPVPTEAPPTPTAAPEPTPTEAPPVEEPPAASTP